MEIKIEDLQIGDEIIILGQVSKYVKIMELPRVKSPKPNWVIGDYFNTVRCHLSVEISPVNVNKWDYKKQLYHTVVENKKVYPLQSMNPGEGLVKKIDLNFHRLWLVNRI